MCCDASVEVESCGCTSSVAELSSNTDRSDTVSTVDFMPVKAHIHSHVLNIISTFSNEEKNIYLTFAANETFSILIKVTKSVFYIMPSQKNTNELGQSADISDCALWPQYSASPLAARGEFIICHSWPLPFPYISPTLQYYKSTP